MQRALPRRPTAPVREFAARDNGSEPGKPPQAERSRRTAPKGVWTGTGPVEQGGEGEGNGRGPRNRALGVGVNGQREKRSGDEVARRWPRGSQGRSADRLPGVQVLCMAEHRRNLRGVGFYRPRPATLAVRAPSGVHGKLIPGRVATSHPFLSGLVASIVAASDWPPVAPTGALAYLRNKPRRGPSPPN